MDRPDLRLCHQGALCLCPKWRRPFEFYANRKTPFNQYTTNSLSSNVGRPSSGVAYFEQPVRARTNSKVALILSNQALVVTLPLDAFWNHDALH